jgi:DNA-binding NarL/FixJ family response regulator
MRGASILRASESTRSRPGTSRSRNVVLTSLQLWASKRWRSEMKSRRAAEQGGFAGGVEVSRTSGRYLRAVAPSDVRPHVLVVEDREDFAKALQKTLEKWCDVTWVRNFDGAVAAFSNGSFSALIVDVRLPGPSGFEVLERFRSLHPLTPVMVLTGYFDEEGSRRACELGAQYVAKPITTKGLEAFVAAANIWTSERARFDRSQQLLEADAILRLSLAERKVYERLAAGDTNEEISSRLCISIETVRTHVRNILTKLGAHSRSQAVAIVQQRRTPSTT